MRCERPIWITTENLKGGYDVPCGKCYACLQRRRSVWTFRILQELRVAESAFFVTLTYGDHIKGVRKPGTDELYLTLYSKDLTLFIKRLRERIQEDYNGNERWTYKKYQHYTYETKKGIKGGYKKKYRPRLRYFASGEYGNFGTRRPHYHIVLYNAPLDYFKYDPIHYKMYSLVLEDLWKNGNIDIGEVNQASAHYIAKHNVINADLNWEEDDPREKPFTRMSRRPGIGANYINEQNKNYFINSKDSYTTLTSGHKQSIGRYYKDKFFPKKEEDFIFRWIDEEGKIRKEKRRIRISSEIERQINRKAIKYGRATEEKLLQEIIKSNEGDIIQSYKDLQRIARETEISHTKKTIRNLKKGKKL